MLDQLSTTMGNTEVFKMWTGSLPANCAAADTTTLLLTITLAGTNDWLVASGGTKTLNSLPLGPYTAAATGTIGYFRGYASGATVCHIQGTVTATGGGGDMTFDNPALTSGQTVNLNTFTLTAPGA